MKVLTNDIAKTAITELGANTTWAGMAGTTSYFPNPQMMVIYDLEGIGQALKGSLNVFGAKDSLGASPSPMSPSDRAYTALKEKYYRFRINPSNVTIRRSKMYSVVETKDGWDRMVWKKEQGSNAMIQISYKGSTGFMLAPSLKKWIGGIGGGGKARGTLGNASSIAEGMKWMAKTVSADVKLSKAFYKFKQMEKFFLQNTNDLGLFYDFIVYKGWMTNFSYAQDANNPFQINYDFDFTAYPNEQKLYNYLTRAMWDGNII